MKRFRTSVRLRTSQRSDGRSGTKTRNRGLARSIWLLTALIAAALFAFLPAAATGAGNPSADLDQCANGNPLSATACNAANESDWINGNVGASKATYFEGDSLPYRMKFDNLLPGSSHTVTIKWDTTKGGTHALDFLTTYNRTVSSADPCAGVTGCGGSPSTAPIPKDPQVDNGSGSPITQGAGVFTFFGASITNVGSYSYPDGTGFSGDKSAQITLTFTAGTANPVLAWAGHIARRRADGFSGGWGDGNAAVNIPGSTNVIKVDVA